MSSELENEAINTTTNIVLSIMWITYQRQSDKQVCVLNLTACQSHVARPLFLLYWVGKKVFFPAPHTIKEKGLAVRDYVVRPLCFFGSFFGDQETEFPSDLFIYFQFCQC